MHKMKNIVSILLAIAMLFSLAACSAVGKETVERDMLRY